MSAVSCTVGLMCTAARVQRGPQSISQQAAFTVCMHAITYKNIYGINQPADLLCAGNETLTKNAKAGANLHF